MKKKIRLKIDKGILGVDTGIFIKTLGWSIGGFNGFYKSDKDGKRHIYDETVHKISRI